jgi:ATP synthase subunit 6
MYGPLAQFDLLENLPSSCYSILLSFFGQTELDIAILLITGFIIIWQVFEYYNEKIRQDNILDFDDEIVISDIISKKNYNYNEIVTLYFSIIFTCNLFGLLPYSQTLTAQLIFTILLSLLSLFTIWLHSFYTNKIIMLNHFLPSGSPLVITPFIIIIELISNISRIVSLSVRLFANMTSGHALLKILASFGLIALGLATFWKILVIFPIIIIFIITILELLIAFLQTYVFVTLTLIYISEIE